MARPRGEFAVAHCAKLAPKGLTRDREAELIPYPLGQIGKPPAYDAMRCRDRTDLDLSGKPGTLLVVEDRSPPWRLARRQAIRTILVEPQDPVAHDLQRG